MRLVQHVPRDRRSKLVAAVFNEVITSFAYPWRCGSMQLEVGDTTKAATGENEIIISIDSEEPLVVQQDIKGIRALIRQQLFCSVVDDLCGQTHPLIREVLAGREMVRHGFGDELMYLYYHRLLGRGTRSLADHAGWLCFAPSDSYNASLLRKMAGDGPHELLAALSRNLAEPAARDEAERFLRG